MVGTLVVDENASFVARFYRYLAHKYRLLGAVLLLLNVSGGYKMQQNALFFKVQAYARAHPFPSSQLTPFGK